MAVDKYSNLDPGGYLEGSFLIATPDLNDTSFGQSVVLLCSHNDEGAMGFILNKQSDIPFSKFMTKLKDGMNSAQVLPDVTEDFIPINIGGPVDTERGFVLHSADKLKESSMRISDNLAMTSTIEMLVDISNGNGPEQAILCLGYSGWTEGQLESEIAQNSWLTCPLDEDAVFDPEIDKIYTKTLGSMGIELAMLSSMSGRA